MSPELLTGLEEFSGAAAALKKSFAFEPPVTRWLCALFCSAFDRAPDPAAVRSCKALLRDSVKLFSPLRGSLCTVFATLLSFEEDPTLSLSRVSEAYAELRAAGFPRGEYTMIAAFLFAYNEEYLENAAERAYTIHLAMKDFHPVLCGRDTIPLTALLALSSKRTSELADEAQRCFESLLPERITSQRNLWLLCTVLALGDKPADEKAFRASQYFAHLKKAHFPKNDALITLGLLAILPGKPEVVSIVVSEAYAALCHTRGIRAKTAGSAQRAIAAVSLVCRRCRALFDEAHRAPVSEAGFLQKALFCVACTSAVQTLAQSHSGS